MLSRIAPLIAALFLSVTSAWAQQESPRLLIEKAQSLLRKEEFVSAKVFLEKAEARLRGKDNTEYGTALAMLGRVQVETDTSSVGLANIERALGVLRNRRAAAPAVAAAEYALARAYLKQRRLADSKSLLERIVEQSNAKSATVPRLILADALRDLGRIAMEKEEWQRGQELLAKALPLLEREFGKKDRRLTPVLNDLGLAAGKLNQSSAARANFERSFSIAVTGGSLEFYGRVARRNRQDELAYSFLKQALPLVEAEYGGSVRLFEVLDALCSAAITQKQYSEAESCLLRWLSVANALAREIPKLDHVPKEALARLYNIQGRFDDAARVLEQLVPSLEVTEGPTAVETVAATCDLTDAYLGLQRWADAKPMVEKLVRLATVAAVPDVRSLAHGYHMLGRKLNELGLYAEASELLKISAGSWERIEGETSTGTIGSLHSLSYAYRAQGRLEDAEQINLRALDLMHKFDTSGKPEDTRVWKAKETAELWNALGQTMRELGLRDGNADRLRQSEEAYRQAIALVESLARSDSANRGAYLQKKATYLGNLAGVLFHLKREQESAAAADEARSLSQVAGKADDGGIGSELVPLVVQALTAKRFSDAENLLLRGVAAREEAYGPDYPELVPLLAFLQYARVGLGKTHEAYDASKRAAEILMRRASRSSLPQSSEASEDDYLQAYAVHVHSAHILSQNEPSKMAALRDDAFGVAQRLIASSTAHAVLQAASRQVEGGGPLANLVRERQDRLIEITTLERFLGSQLGRPRSERNEKEENDVRRHILEGRGRIADLDSTIARDFPQFADLGVQQPVSIDQTRRLLQENEALVQFVSDLQSQKTFAWALTRGDVSWVELPVRAAEVTSVVQALRCGLDEEEWAGTTKAAQCGKRLDLTEALDKDQPLPFDLELAHELYLSLFEPFQNLIADKRLLIVASGPLTSLPFHALVTEKPATAIPASFEGYRNVAWLAKSQPITVLPSVTSLYALRAQSSKRQKAPEDYIGIGDPMLKGTRGECRDATVPDRCPTAEIAGPGSQIAMASAGRATIRGGSGRRNAGKGLKEFYSKGTDPAVLINQVRAMCPLPDTAYELRCVADRFPQERQNLLRDKSATEAGLRKLNADGTLARYRIVHFATHGLVAGDLETMSKRQAEPALVLTPPDKPADPDDDGLLTASEVAQLRLNADWVVLSACSTAAGDGANAEALSGLARAFFYAGTRALLVSHWPVYSDAAVQLTTRTFAELERDPATGRAEAFRRAMIALMDDPSQASNAHPAVWAPFVVVGEGGGD
jgi:CHAT domain-containing protein